LSPRSFSRERQRRIARERRREELRRRRAVLLAGATTGAFALAAPAAHAANLEVNTLNDAAADGCTTAVNGCTLRDAVTDASGNSEDDVITFQSGLSGTIVLDPAQGEIPMSGNNAITINGPGAGVITVSGDTDQSGTPNAGDSRIFHMAGGSSGAITISGLTLTDGYSNGGDGGAIYDQGHPLTIAGAVVTNSLTTGSANDGGGISAHSASSYAPVTVTNSTVSGNRALQGSGGGVYGGSVTVKGSTISGNSASGVGGGLFSGAAKYGPLQVSGSTISGNTASSGGGGIAVTAGKYAADSDIVNSTITQNNSDFFGAGIDVAGGQNTGDSLDITHTTISRNGNTSSSTLHGGGLSLTGTMRGTFRLTDSTISGNGADRGGGVNIGVGGTTQQRQDATLEFNNSTIAANRATTSGGGIYLSYYGNGSGGYKSDTIPLTSTVVAGNAAPSGGDLDRSDQSTSGGFDLSFSMVQAPGDAALTQTPAGSGIVGGDARLNPLGNNGGPTETMLPDVLSPLVDKGTAPSRLVTDQRGDPRTVDTNAANAARGDGTDIGAVELQTGPPAPAVKKAKCKKPKRKSHSAQSAKKKHKKCKKKKRK
jgi:hypothetical protein